MSASYPWQKKQWVLLQSALQNARLSHAYLLSGRAGFGKKHFAHCAAELLLAPSEACPGGRAQQALENHPDFISIEPEEKSKNIKIDQIRVLRDKLAQTPFAGGYQVVVIDPVDTLPIGAANALLKTLEEPSGNVILFLIDQQKSPVLPTILSRCQKILFESDDEQDALLWLKKSCPDIKDEIIRTSLRLTQYAPIKAKEWIDAQCLSIRDGLLQYLILCSQKKSNAIRIASELLKNDTQVIMQLLILLCADMTRVQHRALPTQLFNQDQYEKIKSLAILCNGVALQQFISFLLDTNMWLSRGIALNTQLCLENIFIELEKVF